MKNPSKCNIHQHLGVKNQTFIHSLLWFCLPSNMFFLFLAGDELKSLRMSEWLIWTGKKPQMKEGEMLVVMQHNIQLSWSPQSRARVRDIPIMPCRWQTPSMMLQGRAALPLLKTRTEIRKKECKSKWFNPILNHLTYSGHLNRCQQHFSH